MATQNRDEVLKRVYWVAISLLLIALAIVIKAFSLSVLEAEGWRAVVKKYLDEDILVGVRGSIWASDGRLLAASMPYYDIYFDAVAASDENFEKYLDSLAYCLATFVDTSYTPGGFKDFLIKQRKGKKRYVLMAQKLNYQEMVKVRNFPLFRLGRFKGGLIVEEREVRQRPFGLLAQRTIGYVRKGAKPVGLEGAFDEYLKGDSLVQPIIKMANDQRQPVKEVGEILPLSGADLVTTIDVDIQDLAEQALRDALIKHDAEYGTAVVMEVETGAIRAIANLGRTKDGKLWEIYNYAVGYATEPGSTFKAATMMALLETGGLELEKEGNVWMLKDSVDIEKGKTEFVFVDRSGREERVPMKDASYHDKDTVSVETAFIMSSNVGMAKLVDKHFVQKGRLEAYLKALKQFHLDQPTGIEIPGEPNPLIKDVRDADWSGTTPLWMATGYEVRITPLQLLTFYNAIANNGKMMKPYLVERIQRYGSPIKSFYPKVLDKRIASKGAIAKVQELLEKVVSDPMGTAYKKKRTDAFSFAGKTGTAQLDYKSRRGRRKVVGGHQASFVGYFPAKAPKYSCIVVVGKPKKGGYYGSKVALPVFEAIAEGVFRLRPEVHPPLVTQARRAIASKYLPQGQLAVKEDVLQFLPDWGLPYEDRSGQMPIIAVSSTAADTILLKARKLPENTVPAVVGMGLRDALYELEKRGLKVKLSAYRPGRVARQSIKPGTPLRGQTIVLTLN